MKPRRDPLGLPPLQTVRGAEPIFTAAPNVSGLATISFVSDASNIGNCAPNCQLSIGSHNVTVSGNVYRRANPVLDTPNVTLAARVGDVAPAGAISVTNSSPDAFTEGLKATLGSAPAGFGASGSIGNLAAGATDASSLKVTLNTATAGTFGGPLGLTFVSTGEGTTGAADVAARRADDERANRRSLVPRLRFPSG